MGETANELGGMSIAQARDEIAKASATGKATATTSIKVLLDPSNESAPDPVENPIRPEPEDVGHLLGHGLETSPAPVNNNSPAASATTSLPSVAESNSAASVGRLSTLSHVSVPVTGALPYGSLYVHHPVDSPQTATITISRAKDSTAEVSPPPASPKCLDNGDVFLILDVPEHFTVGLDTIALTPRTGKFLGFRDIPPGPHFTWVSEPEALTRCGYWFVTEERKGDIRVKQWDRYNEVLGEAASRFEQREQKDNIESVYSKLVPYDLKQALSSQDGRPRPQRNDLPRNISIPEPQFADSASIWRQLTDCISKELLGRVTGKKIVSEWLLDSTDTAKGELHFPQQPNKLLKTVVATATELDFLFTPEDVIDLQALNLAGTDYSADTTAQVIAVLDGSPHLGDSDIVGELQFTFLTGMLLGNASCIEQWWYLVLKVILRAHRLAVERPALCRALLATLLAQMVYNDRYLADGAAAVTTADSGPSDGGGSGILDTAPQYRGALREALTVYKRRLNRALLVLDLDAANEITTEQGAVGKAFADLEAWFWRYGWDLRSQYVRHESLDDAGDAPGDDDGGEYLPVVVDADASGREIGLVSF